MKLADFGALWPAERRLAEGLQAGNREVFEVSPGLPGPEAPQEVRLRASFVRALALGGFDDCRVSEKGLRVAGAVIEGDGPEGAETRGLDLEGCTLAGDLALIACHFTDMVLLLGARVQSLFLGGSVLARGLVGDGLEARGGVFLRGAKATGEVRLLGAKLGGDLDCAGAEFTAGPGGNALSADGLETRRVLLNSVKTVGEVRFAGARIAGEFGCEGTTFTATKDSNALSVSGAKISGGFFLRKGAKVNGPLVLTAAEIGRISDDPACWPGSSNLLLNRCRYGAFTGPAPVDSASRIRWLALQDPARFGVDFWPQPYEECARVLREMGHQGDARKVLIEKEKLQRRARRARIGRLNPKRWVYRVADFLLAITVRYGREPLWAFAWLAGMLLLGFGVFGHAASAGAIKPNLPQIQRAPEWVLCGFASDERRHIPSLGRIVSGRADLGETQLACFLRQPEGRAYPRFSPFVYSADALIPVVALEMQSYWIPDDSSARGAAARVYLWLHIAAGWGLTLLAVAGFSGLIKMDSK